MLTADAQRPIAPLARAVAAPPIGAKARRMA
jgi:hypothetical protein